MIKKSWKIGDKMCNQVELYFLGLVSANQVIKYKDKTFPIKKLR